MSDEKRLRGEHDTKRRGRLSYIHAVRNALNWDPERFDSTLRSLRDSYQIQLTGGDPSILTDQEIRDSFTDERGQRFLSIRFIKTGWSENF